MRSAVLHLGFHKTGTTFLQLAIKRWIKNGRRGSVPLFYSSQHMRSSGWLQTRMASAQRFRNRIARAPLGTVPASSIEIEKELERIGALDDLETLRQFFSREEPVLIHSDENSIGAVFGHCGYRPGELWPFYPNGSWLCAAFATAALGAYADIHVVLSLRKFDEMAVSSLKTAAKSHRPFPPLSKFFERLSDMPSRCRGMFHDISGIEFIRGIHVLDHELLKRSPVDYLQSFFSIAGVATGTAAVPELDRMINASEADNLILERLIQRGIFAQDERERLTTVAGLFPDEFLKNLAAEYELLRRDLSAMSSTNGRLRYYY